MNWGIIAPVIIALVAPVGAYLLAARKMSGKIGTSDAAQLWKESASIRDDYRTQLLQANERAISLEIRMAKAEEANSLLVRENYELRHKIEDLEAIVTAQAATIVRLEALVAAQREALGNGPT